MSEARVISTDVGLDEFLEEATSCGWNVQSLTETTAILTKGAKYLKAEIENKKVRLNYDSMWEDSVTNLLYRTYVKTIENRVRRRYPNYRKIETNSGVTIIVGG